jgi:replicative DNA helicase
MSEYGKVPPQAIDIEEVVLGAMLLEKEAYMLTSTTLREEMFYKSSNRKVYKAIKQVSEDNNPIDMMTVMQQLIKNNDLDEIGGAYYLTTLTSNVVSSANIEYHSKILLEKYIKRELIRISGDINAMSYDDSKDIEDIINLNEKGLNDIAMSINGEKKAHEFDALLDMALDDMHKRIALSKDNQMSGIKTPVSEMDAFTNGWQKQELVILGARPAMGKTAMALAIAKTAALEGKAVSIYSLEMASVRLVDRIIVSEADVNAGNYRDGKLTQSDIEKVEAAILRLRGLRISIDDNAVVTTSYIKRDAYMKKRKGECDMIIIDYLQLTEPKDSKQSKNNQVEEISRDLKMIAKELDVPVICLAQLSRAVESRGGDKRPNMSDLRDSGAIEQDADIVSFLYRAEYYGFTEDEEGNSTQGKGEWIISKNRGGKTGVVEFGYNDSLTRIFDVNETETLHQSYEQTTMSVIEPDRSFDTGGAFNDNVPF